MNKMIKAMACMIMLLIYISTIACGQKKSVSDWSEIVVGENSDSLLNEYVSDSIANIIINAKTISCELPRYDTASTLEPVRVCSKDLNKLVKYLFFDDEIFHSDNTVYGIFKPWATIKFCASKGRVVYMVLDFSLGKWKLLNAGKKEICSRDLNGNKHQFMRLITILFPDAKEIKQVLNFNPIKL